MVEWTNKRVLITVKTYPVPAQKNFEVSCTGGITSDGKWIRLYPVPFRLLADDKRFSKYQWIDVDVTKATDDHRPESHKLRPETIKVGNVISTEGDWRSRRELIKPLMRPSMCGIQRERDENKFPTLGIFKPAEIKRLVIEEGEQDWTPAQTLALRQGHLFDQAPPQSLEKIPFNFKYQFRCADPGCKWHEMTCTDWEMGESYRRWRVEYGPAWESKFREKYENQMINKLDTHFYVGTVHKNPGSWIIVGLFYPPYRTTGDLFDL